jgi:hypothetical protein
MTVALNTDGTVSVVDAHSKVDVLGTPVVFESASSTYISSTYDPVNNKVVIAYRDNGNSNYGTAIVGTVAGTTISFGTPVVFESAGTYYNSATFDSANGKVVIAYMDEGNSFYGTAVVGTVSGSTISFGTPVVFESAATERPYATYDSTNGKVVITYRDDGNSFYGTAIVGTVSGTTISFGTPVVFNSARTDHFAATYDPTNNKVVIAYGDRGTIPQGYGTAIVGTVAGTSISFGTPVVFESASSVYISATYDSFNNKVVIAYTTLGISYAIVGTVSGTAISLGTRVALAGANASSTGITYDSTNNKVVIAYKDANNLSRGTAVVGTVSGTSISLDTPVVFTSGNNNYNSPIYDSTNNKVVIAYQDDVGLSSGTAFVFDLQSAIGTPAVFAGATVNRRSATFDSLNNKVVIAYRDTGNLDYGTAVVGTVSGVGITWGTPVVFESATSNYPSATFDSLNNKVVIAYRDDGNSNYGTAIVGTVSGSTISFGAPVVFESGNSLNTSITFDPVNNKVVIAYKDQGNSNYGTAIVGTVSGTSISFGAPVVFESTETRDIFLTFDSLNNKVVIAYRGDSGISGYGTAIVGTVSGTTISFGTPAVFNSGSTFMWEDAITFDPVNNKVVIVYQDDGNLDYGTAVVGTVAGTSISFGTPVVFESAGSDSAAATFDSLNNKVVIAYKDQGNSSYGTAVVGTVSGTSISFDTPFVFNSALTDNTAATYDSLNNKVVIAYRDGGNSNYGTGVVLDAQDANSTDFIGITDQAIADTASGKVIIQGGVSDKVTGLTIGTEYYIQEDGSLSATISSVPAGRALSTTSILI